MKKSLILVIIIFAISSCAYGARLSYPALGNIQLKEGTIEVWIVPEFEITGSNDNIHIPFKFFNLQQDSNNYLWLIWRLKATMTGPYATSRREGNKFTPNWALVEGWSTGEKHHIAFCWKQDKNWWIIDGKKMRETKQSLQHAIAINERLKMVFGGGLPNRMLIDDLRISSIARNESEVGFHTPGNLKVDPWTLLLDTFDTPFECDGVKQTKPKIMMPSTTQTGGIPEKGCKFVTGVKGTALRL